MEKHLTNTEICRRLLVINPAKLTVISLPIETLWWSYTHLSLHRCWSFFGGVFLLHFQNGLYLPTLIFPLAFTPMLGKRWIFPPLMFPFLQYLLFYSKLYRRYYIYLLHITLGLYTGWRRRCLRVKVTCCHAAYVRHNDLVLWTSHFSSVRLGQQLLGHIQWVTVDQSTVTLITSPCLY